MSAGSLAPALGRLNGRLRWLLGVAAATAVVMLFTLDPDGDDPAAAAPDADAPIGGLPAVGAETADADASEPFLLGAQVYAAECASCHGATGEGISGPRLNGIVNDAYPNDADLIALLLTGRVPMPAFSGQLSDDEIEAVVFYLRRQLG